MQFFHFMLLVLLPVLVLGHGKLLTPRSRFGDGYENDPIGFSARMGEATEIDDFVCRHAYDSSRPVAETWEAGTTVQIKWNNSAKHIGDCEIFLSYDFDKPRADMKWFKIANFYNCKDLSQQSVDLVLPSWLKSGRAVLRWGWYALHVHPTMEFYAQCSDIEITSSNNDLPKELKGYSLLNLYPQSGRDSNNELNYRSYFAANPVTWITGPSCAQCWDANNCDFDQNSCMLSVSGTGGHLQPSTVSIGGDDNNNTNNDKCTGTVNVGGQSMNYDLTKGAQQKFTCPSTHTGEMTITCNNDKTTTTTGSCTKIQEPVACVGSVNVGGQDQSFNLQNGSTISFICPSGSKGEVVVNCENGQSVTSGQCVSSIGEGCKGISVGVEDGIDIEYDLNHGQKFKFNCQVPKESSIELRCADGAVTRTGVCQVESKESETSSAASYFVAVASLMIVLVL